jgi:hypothetical protein
MQFVSQTVPQASQQRCAVFYTSLHAEKRHKMPEDILMKHSNFLSVACSVDKSRHLALKNLLAYVILTYGMN